MQRFNNLLRRSERHKYYSLGCAVHCWSLCLVSWNIGNLIVPKEPVFRTYRDFKNFNYPNFLVDLYNLPFPEIYDLHDVNDKVNHLSSF